MKLAEGLSIRKDLQTRIEQLKARLVNNMKVQEGDEPAEQPSALLKELDGCLAQLEQMIFRINATNMATKNAEGKTLTQLMAEREVLGKRIQVLREAFDRATQSQDRYGRNEIKYVTTINIAALRKCDVAIAHCPRCNAQLGMGFAPIQEYLKLGMRVGLGTDSPAAIDSSDIFKEMQIGQKHLFNVEVVVVKGVDYKFIINREGLSRFGAYQLFFLFVGHGCFSP